jgi:protein associated with RNAse G/E
MDCGHYVKRQHQGVRFNEKNAHAQCRGCNWLKQGNDAVYKEEIIKRYGQQVHDLLKFSEHHAGKFSSSEIEILAKEYEKKAKELAKQKGLTI